MYFAFKHAHMMFAMFSGVFFLIRGVWMLQDSARLSQRWVKIVPHINDTLLLACAIVLMVHIQQYPFVTGWLTAKVIALLAYIGLGMVALKPGRPKRVRVGAFALALLCFGYMVSVAINHHALGFLAG